jgi:hypothetical protein
MSTSARLTQICPQPFFASNAQRFLGMLLGHVRVCHHWSRILQGDP